MSNQKVLITGASTGFDFITAKTLAKKGHTVFVTIREVNGNNKVNREQLLQWPKGNGVMV